MRSTIKMLKALSDENRFRIFILLRHKRMCVCEMLRILDIAGSTLSAHLKILKNSELIKQQKDGRWIEYFLNSKNSEVEKLYEFLDEHLIVDRTILDRDKNLAETLSREMCSRGD